MNPPQWDPHNRPPRDVLRAIQKAQKPTRRGRKARARIVRSIERRLGVKIK